MQGFWRDLRYALLALDFRATRNIGQSDDSLHYE